MTRRFRLALGPARVHLHRETPRRKYTGSWVLRNRMSLAPLCEKGVTIMAHHGRHPARWLGRRRFLAAGASAPALALALPSYVSAQEPNAAADKVNTHETWGIPGRYRGQVVEVRCSR